MLTHPRQHELLSLFPGVGLFDRAFEEAGFPVVRGPDLIFGGDIRRFHLVRGSKWGVFGGPPCQEFSSLRREAPTGYGLEMLDEFLRIVAEGEPEWFVLENVSRVPDVRLKGYHVQRLDVDQKWFETADGLRVSRLRHIQFGSRSGRTLHIDRGGGDEAEARGVTVGDLPGQRSLFRDSTSKPIGCATASDKRSFRELCRLQGLPDSFELPGFTVGEAKRAVGNGVPLPMGRAIVRAIVAAYSAGPVTLQRTLGLGDEFGDELGVEPVRVCPCGCKRRLAGKQTYYDESCRKRAQRRRDRATGKVRTNA